jgi:hypothetical protein
MNGLIFWRSPNNSLRYLKTKGINHAMRGITLQPFVVSHKIKRTCNKFSTIHKNWFIYFLYINKTRTQSWTETSTNKREVLLRKMNSQWSQFIYKFSFLNQNNKHFNSTTKINAFPTITTTTTTKKSLIKVALMTILQLSLSGWTRHLEVT